MIGLIISCLFWISLASAEEPKEVCQGPVSCHEDVSSGIGDFAADLTKGLSGVPDTMPETDFKTVETKLGEGATTDDILVFDKIYTEKMGTEMPLPVSRAFMQYRLKLNTRDRGIDFTNANENKSLGLSGPESKPKDIVDVELPENTLPTRKSQKKPRGKVETE